jgi:hypothetical protein
MIRNTISVILLENKGGNDLSNGSSHGNIFVNDNHFGFFGGNV